MNEAKRAAVVKRGAERDHRDLFASRPADLGSVKQTLRPPPPEALTGFAARNETSVLFTVDALRMSAGAARVKTPEPEPAPLSSAFIASDDEGVIDLKSLSSAPPKVGARSVAPLFTTDTPPAAFTADVGAMGSVDGSPNGFKLGKRAIAGIAAAALAVVLCSIGLAAAFKGEEPVAHAANAAILPIAAPATPAPAVVAPAAPVAAPVVASTSTDSSDDDAKVSTTAKGKKKHKGGKAKSGGVASAKIKSSSSDQPLVSKPPKAADKCGCKGDFTCILRCTAKGS